MKILNTILTGLNIVCLSVALFFGYNLYQATQEGLGKIKEIKSYLTDVRANAENARDEALEALKKSELIQSALSKLKIGDAGPGDALPSDVNSEGGNE